MFICFLTLKPSNERHAGVELNVPHCLTLFAVPPLSIFCLLCLLCVTVSILPTTTCWPAPSSASCHIPHPNTQYHSFDFASNENSVHGGYEAGKPGGLCSEMLNVVTLREPAAQLMSLLGKFWRHTNW